MNVFQKLGQKIHNLISTVWNWIFGEKTKRFPSFIKRIGTFIASPIASTAEPAAEEIIRELRAKKVDAALLRRMLSQIKRMDNIAEGASAVLFVLALIQANIQAQISTIVGMMEHDFLSTYPYKPADPMQAAVARKMGLITSQAYLSICRRNGLDAGQAQVILKSTKQLLDAGAYAEALRRGIISSKAFHDFLEKLGIDSESQNVIANLAYSFLTANEYAALLRRGIISTSEYYALAKKAGLTRSDAHLLYLLQERLLEVDALRDAWLRGEISEKTFEKKLSQLNYSSESISLIKKLSFYVPPPADLIRMAVREVFTPEIVKKYGQMEDFPKEFEHYARWQGISPFWAKAYWAAHWDLPSYSQGVEMLHRGIITYDDLKTLLRALDVMPYWRDKLIQLSYNPYTRVDVRRMYRLGVISQKEVYRTYRDLGYDHEHAENLTRFTVLDAMEEEREFSKSEIVDAFKRGIITESQMKKHLKALHYADEVIDYLVQKAKLLKYQEQRKVQVDYCKVMFQSGQWDRARTEQELIKRNFSQDEINYYLALWSPRVREKRSLPTKGELSSWLVRGIIDVDRYIEYMRALGYSDETIAYYLQDLSEKIKT